MNPNVQHLYHQQVWSVQAGRGLLRHGKHVLSVHLISSPTEGYAMPPEQADALVRRIAHLLNTYGETE